MPINVQSSLYYLARDELWKTETPYSLRFKPPDDFPKSNGSNIKIDDILIEDIRGSEQQFGLEETGFTVLRLDAPMSYEDFKAPDKVQTIYLKYVAHTLKATLQADRVQIFDYQIRKSHAQFPVSTGQAYTDQQPANILHIDATPKWTEQLVRELNPENPSILEQRYQYINIWKPLVGPVKRWPLTLCDQRTINREEDLEIRDIVFPHGSVESYEIFPSPKHKFYYLSNQETDEAWLMLQVDSANPSAGEPNNECQYKIQVMTKAANVTGVAHTGFPNLIDTSSADTRESIEIRAIVYYGT